VSERLNRIASGALALVGIGITTYLLSVRASGATLSCTSGGCETVQNSPYSEIFGLPVAALGLVGYVVLLGAALARGDLAQLIGAVVALAAFAFSAYLVAVQVVVIGALCDWCLASDAVTTALAALALLRLRPWFRPPEDRSHAWNAARRSASPSSSARTARGRRPKGSTRTRPSS
jgi:uncharacterized membrane protein